MKNKGFISDAEMSKWQKKNKESKPKGFISDEEMAYGGKEAIDMAPTSPLEAAKDVVTTGLTALDAAPAAARTALEAGLSAPEGQGLEKAWDATKQYGSDILSEGTGAITSAPTGEDVLKAGGVKDPHWSAGVATEMALDPTLLIPSGTIVKGVKNLTRNVGGKKIAQAIGKFGKEKFLKEGVDLEMLGKQIFEEDLTKLVNKPVKLEEALGGIQPISTLKSGDKLGFKKSARETGLIGKIAQDMSADIENISGDFPNVSLPAKDIVNRVSADFADNAMDRLSGAKFDVNDIQKVEKSLASRFQKYPKESFTVAEAFRLKKNLNAELSSRDWFDPNAALENDIIKSSVRQIDRWIKSNLDNVIRDGVNMGEEYSVNNARLHNLISAKKVLETAELKDLKGISKTRLLAEAATAAGITGLASAFMEVPSFMAIGGGYAALRKGADLVGSGADAFMARQSANLGKAAETAQKIEIPLRAGAMAGREMNQMDRSPQSIDDRFVKERFPRNTKELIANKDAFLRKVDIMQPDDAINFRHMMETLPEEQLAKILPKLAEGNPQLFQYDENSSWDGVVPEENRPAAIKKIMDSEMSMTEKMVKRSYLNKTGRLQ